MNLNQPKDRSFGRWVIRFVSYGSILPILFAQSIFVATLSDFVIFGSVCMIFRHLNYLLNECSDEW